MQEARSQQATIGDPHLYHSPPEVATQPLLQRTVDDVSSELVCMLLSHSLSHSPPTAQCFCVMMKGGGEELSVRQFLPMTLLLYA